MSEALIAELAATAAKLLLDIFGGDHDKAQSTLRQAWIDRANAAADAIEDARGLK